METYLRFILRHRIAVLVAIGLITLLALASLSRAVVASSFGRMFLGDSPAYHAYLERAVQFQASDEVLIVGVEDPDVLTPSGQDRLRTVIDALQKMDGVDRVESVLSARRLMKTPIGLPVASSYAEEARRDPQRIPALIEAFRQDPLYKGLLISKDGKSSLVLIQLTVDPNRPVEKAPQIVGAALEEFRAAGYSADAVHQAGLLAIIGEVISQTFTTIGRLLPATALLLLLTVWLLFRRLWPAAVALGVSGVGATWTMGFAVLLDPQVNIIVAAVPAVVLIVATSDVVHLCSAYLLELAKLPEGEEHKRAAILASGEDVGKACLFTSITTFVGFVALSFIPTPVFRILGLVLGVGVGVSLLLAMTAVPIVFSLMGRPKPLREGPSAAVHRVLDGVLSRMQWAATVHPRWVVAGFAALLTVAGVGISRLQVETDFAKRLSADNRVRQDNEWFARNFSGWNALELYVDVGDPARLRDPAFLAQLAALQRELEDLGQVDAVHSFLDGLGVVYQALGGQEKLPPDRRRLTQTLALLQTFSGKDLGRLVDLDQGLVRMAIRLNVEGLRGSAEAGVAVRDVGRRLMPKDVKVEPAGLTYMFGDWLDEIVEGQKTGLLFSILVIGMIMCLGLRSLWMGLGSMPPNLFPLITIGGTMGLLWAEVDSDAISVAFLAIGIGVDDTIHFLNRFRTEAQRVDRVEAIRRTFDFAGRAIFMTTLILIAGFLPFATSDYFVTRMFGTLLPLCLVVALLADLLLLPAMIQLGWLGGGFGPRVSDAPSEPGDAPPDPAPPAPA